MKISLNWLKDYIAFGVSALIMSMIFIPAKLAAEEKPAVTTSLDAFEQMSLEELNNLQVKITYHGPQNEPIPSVLFKIAGKQADIGVFNPHQTTHPDIDYANDEMGFVEIVNVTEEESQSLVKTYRHLSDFSLESGSIPFISVSMHNRIGDKEYFIERILDNKKSQEFFVYFRGALANNEEAQRTLQWWGCALGLLPPGIPAKDVTDKVQVTTAGVEWDKEKAQFEATVTLFNASSEFFYAPISLVVQTYPWRLSYYHGTTCETQPVGNQYIHVKTPSGGLAPKENVSVRLEFEGPEDDSDPIEFTTRVLVGSGER